MITKRVAWIRVVAAGFAIAASQLTLAAGKTFTFAYLQHTGDSFYEHHRAYTGLTLRDRRRPLGGAMTALQESRVVGRALGLKFKLVERNLKPQADATNAIEALMRDEGIRVFLLDLPLDTEKGKVITSIPVGMVPYGILIDDH